MATSSNIEWTEQTWNPTTGCTKIASGCINCYAECMAKRLQAMGVVGYENGFSLSLHYNRLTQPLYRKKPTVYFVNSMSDLFHEDIPDSFVDEVFEVIRKTPQHTYQILTKRSLRLPLYFESRQCPRNVWLGVTVEDCASIGRIKHLQKVNAHIRFLSIEPLLEDIGSIKLDGIHWVIVGGESGPRSRPMSPGWVESIKCQCEAHNIAFFFKQWGGWGADGRKRSKKHNGRELQGQIWDQKPIIREEGTV